MPIGDPVDSWNTVLARTILVDMETGMTTKKKTYNEGEPTPDELGVGDSNEALDTVKPLDIALARNRYRIGPDGQPVVNPETGKPYPILAEALVAPKAKRLLVELENGDTIEVPLDAIKEWQVVWSDGNGYKAHVQTRFEVDTNDYEPKKTADFVA